MAGVTVEFDVRVLMGDGATLNADVFRPHGAGPFPVLVVRTPYGKAGVAEQQSFRLQMSSEAKKSRPMSSSDPTSP